MARATNNSAKFSVYKTPSEAIQADMRDLSVPASGLARALEDDAAYAASDASANGAAGWRGIRASVSPGAAFSDGGNTDRGGAGLLGGAIPALSGYDATGNPASADDVGTAASTSLIAAADGYGAGGNPDGGGFGSGGNPEGGGGGGDGFGSGGNPAGGGGSGDGFGSGGNPEGGGGGGDGYGSGGNPDQGFGSEGNPGGGQGNGGGGGDGIPDHPDDPGNPGSGQGGGTGEGDGISDKPDDAPTPPDVLLQDPDTADWTSSYIFNLDDITLDFDGTTLGVDPTGMDMTTSMVTKSGIVMHPIDSAFGFYVTDFIGAVDKVRDDDFGEGWAGELPGGGIVVSNARTETFSVPAKLGTWLEGIGGNFVKASTEHYAVMQAILSDQQYPGDDSGYYQLDDDLWIVDYLTGDDGMPVDELGVPSTTLVEDVMHGFYVYEMVQALEEAETSTASTELYKDFDRDGTDEAYSAYMADVDFDGVTRNVAVVDIGNDGVIDYYDSNLNGFGTYGLQDVLPPNESSIIEDIAVGDDYSVTVKDDGKLLYRWGNAIKRPNDMRIDAKMDLPDEWTDVDPDTGLTSLFLVTKAELLVNHTVTNNPNDQIRPEDFENEAAIGQLPSFAEVRDPLDPTNVLWVALDAYYAGDGTFLPAYIDPDATSGTVVEDLDGNPVGYLNVDAAGEPIGTVLRDFSLIDAVAGSTLAGIGALSSDLEGGYTEAWYTTMDREPFVAVLNDDGEYEIGPRWRLQPDKFGQDLPSVIIPLDPSDPLPVANGEEKYEVGVDTTTVLNLLDWNGTSPLTLSAGWMTDAGEVSANGVNMTDAFDVAYYIKGDMKPVSLYDAQLVLSFEQVEVQPIDAVIGGTIFADAMVGMGNNTFDLSGLDYDGLDGQADLFVLGYGATTVAAVGANEVYDFGAAEGDALGLIGFGLDTDNYNVHITQEVVDDNLEVSLDGIEIATLYGVTEHLLADDFYFA